MALYKCVYYYYYYYYYYTKLTDLNAHIHESYVVIHLKDATLLTFVRYTVQANTISRSKFN